MPVSNNGRPRLSNYSVLDWQFGADKRRARAVANGVEVARDMCFLGRPVMGNHSATRNVWLRRLLQRRCRPARVGSAWLKTVPGLTRLPLS